MTNETFGRGQIEWTLWRTFAPVDARGAKIPPKFLTRIKRLLDIDRNMDLSAAEEPPLVEYAFAEPSPNTGVETSYSLCDVFCLGVALDLLDSGFKQSEVVYLMRYLRIELENRVPELLEPPSIIDRQDKRAAAYPKLPSFKDGRKEVADRRVFLILKKVEVTEIVPEDYKKRASGPIILDPIFCHGLNALSQKLFDLMPENRRAVTILELASTAQSVNAWLAEAPEIRRGRPKEKE